MNHHVSITPDLTAAIDRHRAAYAMASRHYCEDTDRLEGEAWTDFILCPAATLEGVQAKVAYISSLPVVADNLVDGAEWMAFLRSISGERAAA